MDLNWVMMLIAVTSGQSDLSGYKTFDSYETLKKCIDATAIPSQEMITWTKDHVSDSTAKWGVVCINKNVIPKEWLEK